MFPVREKLISALAIPAPYPFVKKISANILSFYYLADGGMQVAWD